MSRRREPLRGARRLISRLSRRASGGPARSEVVPACESLGETGRLRAAFIAALAELERGQEDSLVRCVEFAEEQALVVFVDGTRLVWTLHSTLTSHQLAQRLTRESALAVREPVADRPETVYDISTGGHIAWVWLLHYLGNYYGSALLEESPCCGLERIERVAGLAQVTGRRVQGTPHTFEVPLDGSYDVIAAAFDVGLSLRAGRSTLLYV